jgi:8-oxo-dGTP pyrophosphatase MutT (NUDIX family)
MSRDATPPARLIRLRRPPRIVIDDSVFVPAVPRDDVDSAWAGIVAGNSRFTDGECLHVVGVHRDGHGGATIHAVRSSYRMGAVRRRGVETGFRGLGTKAIAHVAGQVLLGRRSAHVNAYPGLWEFAPGGGVEIGEAPEVGIVRELMEECGVAAAGPARAVALLFDPCVSAWEIVHDLVMAAPPDAAPGWEYSELAMRDPRALPEGLSPCAAQMCAVLDWCDVSNRTRGG